MIERLEPNELAVKGNTDQINGAGSLGLDVEAEVLHELNVVHVDLLAEVALERHVSLELAAQDLEMQIGLG